MSEPVEKVFYDRDGVRVTSARFQVGGQTFAMSSVTSVDYRKSPPRRGAPLAIATFGFFPMVFGFLMYPSTTAKAVAAVIWLFGAFLFCGGIVAFRRAKPTFSAVLTTAAGQTSALAHEDARRVEPVVRALNEALVSRG